MPVETPASPATAGGFHDGRPEQRLSSSLLRNLNWVRYRAWTTFSQGVAEVQVHTCHTHSLISENLTSPPGGKCPDMSCTQQNSETWEAAMENLGPLDLAFSQALSKPQDPNTGGSLKHVVLVWLSG